jgi:phosphate acetyltransferase
MANNLYVAAAEPYSGKVVVSLGVMSALERMGSRIGFFRPVARPYRLVGTDTTVADRDTHLFRHVFKLPAPESEMYGIAAAEAESLLSDGQTERFHEKVLSAFKRIEEDVDFVLCEGTDFVSLASATEDILNAEIARHFNCPVLLVIDGSSNDADSICSKAKLAVDGFRQKGCEVLSVFANKVDPVRRTDLHNEIQSRLQKLGIPIIVCLPYEPDLSTPRMDEIAAHLDGTVLFGRDHLHNKVAKTVVASGSVETIIPLLDSKVLLVTHIDRHDVLFMAMTALASHAAPNIGGILLSGEREIAPPVLGLLKGVPGPRVPIVRSNRNTFETVMELAKVKPGIQPDYVREIEIGRQLFETHVDGVRLMEAINISAPKQMTPAMFKYEIVRRARADKRRIVLPESGDDRILKATDALLRLKAVDVTLLGRPDQVRNRSEQLGLDIVEAEIVEPQLSGWVNEFAQIYFEARSHKGITLEGARETVLEPPVFGTMMVHTGKAQGMVAGATHSTAMTIRPALQLIKTKAGSTIVSSVFFMCLADRVLVYGDCAINPDPNPNELAEIAIASAETARSFGIEPVVAMLSYSTGDSGAGADVDKVREAVQIAKQRAPNLILEGPLQYDAAVDATVAKTKLPDSKVGGHATVFVFPDLNTGNNTYKAVQRSAGAIAVGPILQGLNKPVNDLSRGCRVEDIVNTVAITAIQAQSS